jgi:hypothetical protein
MLVVQKVGLLDNGELLLPFLEIARTSLLHSGILLFQFGFTIALFLGSGWFFCWVLEERGVDGAIRAGMPEFFAIGLRWAGAFCGIRLVEEKWMLLLVPRVAASVFIYFDFEVYLHENNNNSIIDIAYILNISLCLLLVIGIIAMHEYFKQVPKGMFKFLSITKCKITLYNINSSLINSSLYYSQWCPSLPKKDLENASKAILLWSVEARKHPNLQYKKTNFSLPPPRRKDSLSQ